MSFSRTYLIAFIFPSLYEGFGIPPLEAMANKCPVISSNTSSMPEVIGDAAEYFNPNSIENLIYAIEKVVFSDSNNESAGYCGSADTKVINVNTSIFFILPIF